jgi:RNA polymerase-binding transcription factor DksA
VIEDQERMADPVDVASDGELRNNEEHVRRQRALAAPEQVQLADADGVLYWPITECVDCDGPIPDLRLRMGRVRCVECQSAKERMNKLYGGK